MLTQARWEQLQTLFHRACSLPPEQRHPFVLAQASHDETLQRELEALLAVEDGATVRLRAPLLEAVKPLQPAPELPPGTRFGPWAIDRLLGSGGMGRVYLGHRADGAFEREVAVKVVGAGLADPVQEALFELECRALAQMQHPCIAEIHDAGRDAEGRAYLVMEYIRGLPLTEWCDAHGCTPAQRMDLLARVAEGVQHAHQKGVVHRDLKPGNILVEQVDGQPLPKIIDFGIALAGAAEPPGWSGGTPGYMSPEQRLGLERLDARADVYALGALAYALLCGSHPPARIEGALQPLQDLRALPVQARQAAAGRCGQSPRALLKALDDGLDAIVGKATWPVRSVRYEAASALADDLRRWQSGRVPRARPAARAHSARRFLARNRLPAVAAGVATLCLVAGLVASLWSLSQARQQQRVAQDRQAELERVTAFQQQMLESVQIDQMGRAIAAAGPEAGQDSQGAAGAGAALAPGQASALARALLGTYVVGHALQRVDTGFATNPVLGSDVRYSLARVLLSIGDYAQAAEQLQQVRSERLHRLAPADPQVVAVTADLAEALGQQGRYVQATDLIQAQLRLQPPVAKADPVWLVAGRLQAWLMLQRGQFAPALARQQALEQAWSRRLGADDPALLDLQLDIVDTLARLTRRVEARTRLEALLPRFAAVHGQDDARTEAATLTLAGLLNTFNEYERSQALAAQIRSARERRLGADHPATLQAMALEGFNRVRLAQAQPAYDQAEAFMDTLIARERKVLGPDHPDTLRAQAELIRLLAKQDVPAKDARALAMQRDLLAARRRLLGPMHPDTLFTQGGLASMLARTDHYLEARRAARATLEGLHATQPDDYRLVSATWDVLGRIEAHARHWALARQAHQQALAMRVAAAGPLDAHTTESASRLYAVLAHLGDAAAMAQVRTRYLDPVIARDPAGLDASLRSVREEALEAIGQAGGGPLLLAAAGRDRRQ